MKNTTWNDIIAQPPRQNRWTTLSWALCFTFPPRKKKKKKEGSWCFMPSQPVWLYQGDRRRRWKEQVKQQQTKQQNQKGREGEEERQTKKIVMTSWQMTGPEFNPRAQNWRRGGFHYAYLPPSPHCLITPRRYSSVARATGDLARPPRRSLPRSHEISVSTPMLGNKRSGGAKPLQRSKTIRPHPGWPNTAELSAASSSALAPPMHHCALEGSRGECHELPTQILSG